MSKGQKTKARIYHLVCEEGLSDKQIAHLICRSEATVKTYLRILKKRYGAQNRVQLAIKYWKGRIAA